MPCRSSFARRSTRARRRGCVDRTVRPRSSCRSVPGATGSRSQRLRQHLEHEERRFHPVAPSVLNAMPTGMSAPGTKPTKAQCAKTSAICSIVDLSCPCRKLDTTSEAESDDAAARWGISAGCSGAPWSGYFGRVLRWKPKSFCFDISSMFCDENLPSEWPLLTLTACVCSTLASRRRHRPREKPVGPRADELLKERWISSLPLQCLPQCDPIKRDTKTGLIEAIRG